MKKNKYGPNHIGNVLRIVDERTLLIVTTDDDLEVGDTIQVYEVGPSIHDLEGNYLCDYEFIKDELEIIDINMHYCVCQKMKTRSISKPSAFAQLSLSPLLPSTITEYVPLMVEEEDIEPLKIKDPFIRVNDPVKLAKNFN